MPRFKASSIFKCWLLLIFLLRLFNLFEMFSSPKSRKYGFVMSDGDLLSRFFDFSSFRCDAITMNVDKFSSATNWMS